MRSSRKLLPVRNRAARKSAMGSYRSIFERDIADALEELGIKFTYESKSYPWREVLPSGFCNDCGAEKVYADRTYTPDFFLENGYIIEAKGMFTSKDRKIALAMREQHPEIKLVYLFGHNNRLSRGSSTTYLEWCRKRKFEAADKKQLKSALKMWAGRRDAYGSSDDD